MAVFRAHDIRYFLYNGGGDSQDTANKIARLSIEQGFPITCIGVPKTVDNDLPITDNCPGFGSVAKYVAVSIREAGLDVASMCDSSTKVFVMEVMGRHAGWIAGAAGLASERQGDPPHIILFPEITFDRDSFLRRVADCVDAHGYCTVVVSEGVKGPDGRFLSEAGGADAFGHAQLGGVAPLIADMIKQALGHKYHWAVADYLQRAARHIASRTDVEQAYAVGRAAVEFALAGKNAVMPTIVRDDGPEYSWRIGEAPLADVANVEKKMPRDYISADGFHITESARKYFAPLIRGEDYPPYRDGLPDIRQAETGACRPETAGINKPPPPAASGKPGCGRQAELQDSPASMRARVCPSACYSVNLAIARLTTRVPTAEYKAMESASIIPSR